MKKHGVITKVSGPLIVASGMESVQVYDVVKVSDKHLIGEVLELRGDFASIQVYEETAGIGPGEPVYFTNEPLSVELGPGLLEGIFDGIERPLDQIYLEAGAQIPLGIDLPRLDRNKKWQFKSLKKKGDFVTGGDILGEVEENDAITHKIMVPPHTSGEIISIKDVEGNVETVVAQIKDNTGHIYEVKMIQSWPVRIKRPYKKKLPPTQPMVT